MLCVEPGWTSYHQASTRESTQLPCRGLCKLHSYVLPARVPSTAPYLDVVDGVLDLCARLGAQVAGGGGAGAAHRLGERLGAAGAGGGRGGLLGLQV